VNDGVEDEILEEEAEEDFDLDMFGEEDDEDLGFDDADIDISDVKKGFAGFGGGGGDKLFSLHSIGFDVGMYGPSMSYWNDEFISDPFVQQSGGSGQSMTGFAMGPLFQGSTTIKLGSKIRVSLSGGCSRVRISIDICDILGYHICTHPSSHI
jgi:hypothetical protein